MGRGGQNTDNGAPVERRGNGSQAKGLTFPLDGRRGHQLMTAELMEQLPAIGSTDGDGQQATVYLRLFIPGSRYTLYVTEFDGEDKDTLYGYCISPLGPDCDEWGYSSLRELADSRHITERDLYFTPKPLADCLKEDRHTA